MLLKMMFVSHCLHLIYSLFICYLIVVLAVEALTYVGHNDALSRGYSLLLEHQNVHLETNGTIKIVRI